MGESYVGIVSKQGLELLIPENEHLLRFLCQRVYRKRPYSRACVWVVLPSDLAQRLEAAWRLLQNEADHVGPVLPSTWEVVRNMLPAS